MTDISTPSAYQPISIQAQVFHADRPTVTFDCTFQFHVDPYSITTPAQVKQEVELLLDRLFPSGPTPAAELDHAA